MMKRIFLIQFLLFQFMGFAQPNLMDSLKTALKNATHDTTRCYTLTALIENEYDDKVWPIYNNQLFDLAKACMENAATPRLKKVYTSYYAQALSNKGYLVQESGNISKALEFYYGALKLQEQINDKISMATNINNIAYIYMHQGDMNKALESVNKAMALQEESGDNAGIALSLNNLGNIYRNKNEIAKALDYFFRSRDLQQKLNNKFGESICLSNIGDIYIDQGNTKEGTDYLLESLKMRQELGEQNGISYNLNRLANVMYEAGRLDEALKYGTESFKVAKELNYIENIRNASKTLYKIYKKQNNEKEALKMFELYFQMHDSISNENTRKSSIRNQLQYEYDKKATADSVIVAEEKKLINAKLEHERTQRFALYGGIILVGLFGAFMFNRFKVTKRQNHLIQEQKAELQIQKDLVEEHQKETLDSIHYAKRIQSALIANSEFITRHLPNNFIYFNPKDIVSGDFYWATWHKNKFYLAVCDSTGHGVPGAFMSLLNIGFLSEAIKEKNIEKPNEVFDYIRERLISSISEGGQKDGMDGVLICIDKNQDVIEYAAANNEPILIRNNQLSELPKDRMPVGKGGRVASFTLHSVKMQPGDVIYLYTDGFADQFGGPKGKKYKYKQLNELLLANHQLPMDQQFNVLESSFTGWKGNFGQVDDVLLLGIKF